MLLYITVVKHFVAENSNFLSYKIKKKKLSLNFEFLPEFQSFALRCSGRVGSSCTTSGNRFTIELFCAIFLLKNLQRV
jgi:hypothetical protein